MDASGHPPARTARTGWKPPGPRAWVLVLALAAVGVAVGIGGTPTRGSPAPPRQPAPGIPVALTATAKVDPFEVTLSWAAPEGSAPVVAYKVFRDHLQIAAVPADTTTYTDHNVFPGSRFTYEVLTSGAGILESVRARTQVSVPVPPVSAAMVAGDFNVKAVPVSQHGFRGGLGSFTLGWSFAPTCDLSACPVQWKDLTEQTLGTTLARQGTTYSGSDRGKFLGRCGSVVTDGTVTITFRVSHADQIGNAWRATTLVGSIGNSIPSQLGCVSAGARLSFTATLVS